MECRPFIRNLRLQHDNARTSAHDKLVYGRNQVMMLNAMLPHITDEDNLDVTTYLQGAKEASQLTGMLIENEQRTDSQHYNRP